MKKFILIILTLAGTNAIAQISHETHFPSQPLLDARECILMIIAPQMHVQLSPEIARPQIRPETTTSLKEFQDSIEEFWKFRPDGITNVFNPLRNEIFIFTDRSYYKKFDRSVFDSLAHELVHYIQHHYQHVDLNQDQDVLESEAVYVQSWFRETYRNQFQGDDFICPLY